jgi:cholesterol oxidase
MDRFDAIVIGSGFGGAVAACRLTQAGQRVCLLERGRRFTSTPVRAGEEPHSDFPKLPASDRVLPDMARLIWENDRGLWQMRDLGNVKAFVAAGYGGGSLIYANVHLRPPEEAFETWPEGTRGKDLEDYYRLAA